jgi:Uma2 family endonuclease
MAIAVTSELLEDALGRGYHIREEKPIVLNDRSEPEPDIVVLKGRGRDYHDHPTSDQVLLVIEVSDSRLQYDMIDKAASYAAAGIREYWVINLVRRVIEVYRDPIQASESASGYEYSLRYVKSPGEKLSMLEFPNISLAVDDMLPSNLSRPTVSI